MSKFPSFVSPMNGESTLYVASPAKINFIRPVIPPAIAFVIAVVIRSKSDPTGIAATIAGTFFFLTFLLSIAVLIKMLFVIYSTKYVVTNCRIIYITGLISVSIKEVRLDDVRGVNLNQTILERLINVGSINIGTAATAETEISMTGVKSPKKIFDLINSYRKA